MDKKKQVCFYAPLYILPVWLFFFFYLLSISSLCLARNEDILNTSLNDTWLSADSMLLIMENLKVETPASGEMTYADWIFSKYSGDNSEYVQKRLLAYQYSTVFNNWFNSYSYRYDVNLSNIVFYWSYTKSIANNSFNGYNFLGFYIRSGTSIYVQDFVPYYKIIYDYDINYPFLNWQQWNYNSNTGNINGVTLKASNNNLFSINTNTVQTITINNSDTTATNSYTNYNSQDVYILNNNEIYVTTMAYLTFNNQEREFFPVAYRGTQSGSTTYHYNIGFLKYFINLGSGDTPTPTPTGTGVPSLTPTGSTPGGSDLSNIENGINNIENALTTTPSGDDFISISSGDILSALDLPAIDDPSANFWLAITDGLTTALTCPNNTSIQIPFIGANFTANSSDFELPDNDLKTLIRMACVVGFVLVEYKLIRKIIAYFSSGVFKQIFNAYSRMDISDLF